MNQAPPPVSGSPAHEPLARLPLQIGTSSVWSAGRSAAVLFPGLALLAVPVFFWRLVLEIDLRVVIPILAVGGLLTLYAVGHVLAAFRTRASDILLFGHAFRMNGGRHHDQEIAWSTLKEPYAVVEETKDDRLTMKSIGRFTLAMLSDSSDPGISGKVTVWRLYVHEGAARRVLAETDRPIERESMNAAAASISAVVSGQRYVAEAPAIETTIALCPGCGAPAVPDDTPTVACSFCGAQVPLAPEIRGQAAAAKALSAGRTTTADIIHKLRDQPFASHTNVLNLVVGAVMFLAWPIGWGLIGYRVLADGFQGSDVVYLLLPFAVVLSGFFLARGRLADRGALQLLTLGFGALGPSKPGAPPRCRRCQGPLAQAGLGGVAHCRYCNAENVVGLDLRPTVDKARTEQTTFDAALAKRAAEKQLWLGLTVLAAVVLVIWGAITVSYITRIEKGTPSQHSAPSHGKPGGGKHGH